MSKVEEKILAKIQSINEKLTELRNQKVKFTSTHEKIGKLEDELEYLKDLVS